MKISEKQLAEALFLVTKDKSQKEVDSVLDLFVREIVDLRKESKIDSIIEKYSQIFDEDAGILKVKLTSAHDLDKAELDFLETEVIKRSGAKKIVFKKVIDKTLLGGVVIEYGAKVLDISLKKRIKLLKEELVK